VQLWIGGGGNQIPSHPIGLFSEVASMLSSSGVPSYDFYGNFCHFRTL